MTATLKKPPFYKILYFQVLAAVVLGVLLGHLYPSLGVDMKPFGDAFIKGIKMLIAPIIFCTVVLGIAGVLLLLLKLGKKPAIPGRLKRMRQAS